MDGHNQKNSRARQALEHNRVQRVPLTRTDCVYIEAGHADRANNFVRNIYINKKDFCKFKKKYNNTGIFTSAYAYDIKNPDEAYLIGNLYLDLDDEKNFSNIREDALIAFSYFENICGIEREYINIFFSGKKGLHITIPDTVFGFIPDKDINKIFKAMASDIKIMTNHHTVDTRIYDKRRLFRVPRSIHQETGLYKTPLTYNELQNLSHSRILRLAETPRVLAHEQPIFTKQAHNIYLRYVDKMKHKEYPDKLGQQFFISWSPPCIRKLFKKETCKGERNNTCAILAGHFKCRRFELDRIMKIMHEWNSKYCTPSLTVKEIEKTVKSLYASQKNYGCNTFRGLELCDPKCRHNK
jgi:hypothetical protein